VPHGNANTDSDTDRYSGRFTDANSYCDSYRYAYSNSYFYAYSHGDSYCHRNSDGDGHSHSDGNAYSDIYANRDRDGHGHGDRNCNRVTAKYAYAAASAHTGAPLGLVLIFGELARTNSRAPNSKFFQKA
jgi:hypothetical protein